ncbi:unnamed protein product, partial [Ectocarpus sp. 12 AP-2014]
GGLSETRQDPGDLKEIGESPPIRFVERLPAVQDHRLHTSYMKSFVGTRRKPRRRSLLLSVLVVASAGGPPAWAQVATTTCGSTSPLRVE